MSRSDNPVIQTRTRTQNGDRSGYNRLTPASTQIRLTVVLQTDQKAGNGQWRLERDRYDPRGATALSDTLNAFTHNVLELAKNLGL